MQTTTTTTTTAATVTPFVWKYMSDVKTYGFDMVFDTIYILAMLDNVLNTYFGV